MRPAFGAGLENFLHEPNTLVTRKRIQDLVTDSLNRWESRIILNQVEVEEVADSPNHIRVQIFYQLRRTGISQQLGLTMQLEG